MNDFQPNDVMYVLHNSTLYFLLYAAVQISQYIFHILYNNKVIQTYFFKYQKKIKKTYCQYTKSSEYQDISNKIEHLKKKIKKYTKLIEENKKSNKHMNEYDLLILNGKFTRKLLKEEKNLNDLNNLLEQENQGDYLFHACDILSSLVTSNSVLANVLRTQITVTFLFLYLKYLSCQNAKLSHVSTEMDIWFGKHFKIISTEPWANNLINLLYGYNTAHVVFLTLKQNVSNLFIKSEVKMKTV
ncbi:hypothetical protein, conserved [Plasmodium gonderi]|uniref:Uncharacterized protein n=1 Tax=Plasmodium gonderi TaxID=77519 RepID=A0A1Y1JJB0_PLAGO|nr:hypothetical protein, conserved [Plasmodium gonderi]GAW81495.1 hypothetical protein, conserved [Plasmodium gonderi]